MGFDVHATRPAAETTVSVNVHAGREAADAALGARGERVALVERGAGRMFASARR